MTSQYDDEHMPSMTVYELIQQLSKYPPDWEVVVEAANRPADDEPGDLVTIYRVGQYPVDTIQTPEGDVDQYGVLLTFYPDSFYLPSI